LGADCADDASVALRTGWTRWPLFALRAGRSLIALVALRASGDSEQRHDGEPGDKTPHE
jgi:hypothetical protein